jgi:hypothetical protein
VACAAPRSRLCRLWGTLLWVVGQVATSNDALYHVLQLQLSLRACVCHRVLTLWSIAVGVAIGIDASPKRPNGQKAMACFVCVYVIVFKFFKLYLKTILQKVVKEGTRRPQRRTTVMKASLMQSCK